MKPFPFPLAPVLLRDIKKRSPLLLPISTGTIHQVRGAIRKRCDAIKDPWVKSIFRSLVKGTPVGVAKESGHYYIEIKWKAGTPEHGEEYPSYYLSEPGDTTAVERSLRRLGIRDSWLIELFVECDNFRDSEVSGFENFGDPTRLSTYIKKFSKYHDKKTTVFAEGNIDELPKSRLNADDWICVYNLGNGDQYAMDGKKRTAWYWLEINRIIVLPFDVRILVEEIVAKSEVMLTLDKMGISEAYRIESVDDYRSLFFRIIRKLKLKSGVRERLEACLCERNSNVMNESLDRMVKSGEINSAEFKKELGHFRRNIALLRE